MVYLGTICIAAILYFFELSFLPHFYLWVGVPFVLLPFISIINLKDRTIFPVILAAALGVLMDGVSSGVLPVYTIAFLSIAVISKVFLNKFLSYGEYRANLINVSIGLFIIYGTDIAFRIKTINSWGWAMPFTVGIALTYLIVFLYMYFGRTYFEWVEKETEERFR